VTAGSEPTSSAPPRYSGTEIGSAPRLEEVVHADTLRELAASFRRISGYEVHLRSSSGTLLVGSSDVALESAPLESGEVVVHVVPDTGAAAGTVFLVAPIEYDHDVIGRIAIGPITHSEHERPRALLEHLRLSLDLILHAGQRAHYASTMHLASIEESYAELLRKNEELEAAYDRLKQLDHLKSSFLATVSHELRTPLTSIIGYSEMLAEGMCGPLTKDQLEFVQTIRQKGDQLLKLILSLLDLSKLESGTLRMHPMSVPIEAVVNDAISTIGPAATKKGVRVFVEPGIKVPPLRADPDRLRQVFVNLIDNAVKFTPKDGTVSVSIREVEASQTESAGLVLLAPVRREIEVRVKDTGIGVPEHERQRIFDPFYQVDQSSTREQGGAGLGLAIVRRIVEAHQGRIRVEENHPHGSAFVVVFPFLGTSTSGQRARVEPP
jgi:two-component system, NarL family, sensor histidine kinase BarA